MRWTDRYDMSVMSALALWVGLCGGGMVDVGMGAWGAGAGAMLNSVEVYGTAHQLAGASIPGAVLPVCLRANVRECRCASVACLCATL